MIAINDAFAAYVSMNWHETVSSLLKSFKFKIADTFGLILT